MRDVLKILLLEDEPADAELVEGALRKAGILSSFKCVGTRGDFIVALKEFRPDIILADYRLPAFDGLAALSIARAQAPDVPFILVSGAMADELAVELLKTGARDYILKDRLARLPSAVRRALAEADEIRQRRAAEKALRDSEEMFRTMTASAQDAIILLDGEAHVAFWNAAAERIFGFSTREVFGRDLIALFSPERLRACYRTTFENMRHTKAGSFAGKTVELSAIRHDGSEFPLEISMASIVLDDKWHAMFIARDISERKQLERELARYSKELEQRVERRTAELARLNQSLREANRQLADAHSQLLQSERMAALGQLAGGVAHEINNPLAFISSNFITLKRYFDDLLLMHRKTQGGEAAVVGASEGALDLDGMKADTDALVEEAKDGLSRVSKIVESLRGFASADLGSCQSFDLHDGLESTISLLHWRITNADIIRDYGQIPEIRCLPSEINLVFMNLLLNASEAISGHGTITVRTRAGNGGVWVEVIDTGCGIPEGNLHRVFDPFFTTKEIGQGLGLGLSLSYGIVQRHHGRLEVTSELGKGTTFRLWLPCHQDVDSAEVAPADVG